MGHRQSYTLESKEVVEKTRDPVRGIQRVSKEHQTNNQFAGEGNENLDYREGELRDRIRKEQLRKREDELATWRVKQHESRDPIIDAYRTTTPPAQSFTEFNYYDSLKHPHPVDPTTYFRLRPRKEVNEGEVLPLKRVDFVPAPMDPSPVQQTSPSRKSPAPKNPGYPQNTPVFSGRLSPLSRHQEVDPHPMPRYVPPMSEPRYDLPVGTYSKTTTVTTYTHYGNRGAIPQYDEVPVASPKPTNPENVLSKVPQYDEVPIVPPKPAPQYDQVPTDVHVIPVRSSSPPSSPSVLKFPRASSRVPQYDKVPEETPVRVTYNIPVSTVPSSQSSPSSVSIGPHYDPVPDEKYTVTLPASANTTYSKKTKPSADPLILPDVPYATYSTRGYENIPIYVLPQKKSRTLVIPIKAEKLESLSRAEDVSATPLREHVKFRAPPVPQDPIPKEHVVPIRTTQSPHETRRPETVLSKGSEVTRETTYSTVPRAAAPRAPLPRRKPSIIGAINRKTPTPLPTPPLERQSEVRGTPIDHYVTHRSPSPVSITFSTHSSHSNRTSTPSNVLGRQTEVRETPLKHYVSYRTPTPTPVLDKRTPTPPIFLDRQEEVRRTPLDHYVSSPSEVIPIAHRTPTPPSQLRKTSEVRGTPLENYVPFRESPTVTYTTKIIVPPSSSPDYRTLPVVDPGPYGTRPITPPTNKMHLERRHSDVERVSLNRYVATRTHAPYPVPAKAPLYLTPLQREVSRAPLDRFIVLRAATPYRTNSIPSLYSSTQSVTPASLYRTQLQPEARRTPVYHYVSSYSKPRHRDSNYRNPRDHVSELHAEKRMIYEVPDDNVTYVKVIDFPTYSATPSMASSPSPKSHPNTEPLYRESEVSHHPVHILPSQTHYEKQPKLVAPSHRTQKSLDKETQYSRRPSEDAVLDYPRYAKHPKTCNVENCTHVEVRDTPVVARRTISEDPREEESRLRIFVNENDARNVVDLARDEEDVGPETSRRCSDEEKLYYNSYMPTLSLTRRPIVSFYDKLH